MSACIRSSRGFTALAAACVTTLTLTACGQDVQRAADARLDAASPSSTASVPTSTTPPSASVAASTAVAATPPSTTIARSLVPPPGSTPKSTSMSTPPNNEQPLPPGALLLPSPQSGMTTAIGWEHVDIVTNANHECVWLQGRDGTKRAALWPQGHYALFDPLRVFDESGREVWRAGQLHHVGGTTNQIDRIPKKCRIGDVAWMAPGDIE